MSVQYVKLGDVCAKDSSNIAQKDLKDCFGKYPVYGAGGYIQNVDFYHQEDEYIAIVKDGAGVGRAMILPAKSSVIGTMQYIIPDKNKVDMYYLYYAIINMELGKYFSGATIPHIYFKDYQKEIFKLPNLKIQKKIADNLKNIDLMIAKKNKQISLFNELVKSRFIEMFGEPLKNNKKWKTKKLKLIAPANEFTGDIEANGKMYWLLQLDMIESNTGKVLNKNLVTLDEIGASTIKFSSDNVLYSKLRPYLNKVVLPDEPGFATSEIIPLLPNEELNKIFLAFLLRDNGIVRFLNAHVSGSKMPRVQADIFWNLDIILPTITLQNQFADFVKQTDKSKLEIQKSLDKLEILKKSLMQKYF